jgi:hypothetical protein
VIQFIGNFNNLSLFTDGVRAVVVDTELNLVTNVDYSENLLSSQDWVPSDESPNDDLVTLAIGALKYLDNSMIASAGSRMYTIPGGVRREAKKALEWRKEYKRGGTPVGLNTARTLAKGGQVGIEKIRHIAKYFPRHEVDKKAKGYEPGEDNFPSNGRIAWALWGGDAGQRWASAIVKRENKKSITSGGQFYGPEVDLVLEEQPEKYSSDINAFKMAHELDPYYGPEFMARVRLDNSGIDRLYKIEIDGQIFVWDGSVWDNMGNVDGDVYLYDSELDDPEDSVKKTHVLVDPTSAIVISAFLQERPFQPVLLEEIDPEETRMMYDGLYEEDFSLIDRVITAAGESASKDDGVYSPEERAENASKQVRDATGRFATVGQRVAVGGDTERGAGTITSVDSKNGLVDVKLDSGRTVTIASKYSQPLKTQNTRGNAIRVSNNENMPLDMSGILGEPRTPHNQPKAHLPGTLPPLTDDELRTMLEDFPKYVRNQRRSYKPSSKADKERVKKEWGVNKFKENSIIAALEAEAGELTPETTDVPAKYLALVSPDDKTAVMDLVAIVPASSTSTEPAIYERKDGQWQKNDQILMDLKSTTPPPVVPLRDKEILNDVLLQVDDMKESVQASAYSMVLYWEMAIEPILAAGGLDRNRGNAESLRRYWTKGKGALKIRWGTPGDWKRCVRNLSKYMGPRAKGYCQLRHKEATGVYTGSKFNPGRKKSLTNMSSLFASEQEFLDSTIEKSRLSAVAADARAKMGLTAAGSYSTAPGASFSIPMLVPEEVESGDGRKFKKGSISARDLPVPLLWQIKTGAGHDGSVVVGRIDYIERLESGIGNAKGVFDNGAYGREAERLVRNGFLRGVSVDLDQFEAKEDKSLRKEASEDGDNEIGKDKLTINKARIMAATIVAKPAFQECTIEIQEDFNQEESVTPEDGVYEESVQDFSDVEPILASGFLKAEVPIAPPADWYANPGLTKPTPLTVDEYGRVYGHIAAWNVSHIGLPRSTKPPRSRSKYAYFNTGVIRTAEGTDVPVGQLTLAGGHAPLNADAAAAARHYDDTASAVADIHVGEDEYGIWCAGSLRPDLNEMQVRALRASAPSGDWRPVNGSLELVAICQVNVPGFPTARAMVASGKILALVAAGASEMALLKSNAYHALAIKAELLGQLTSKSEEILSRAASQFGYMNKETREKLAKEGKAMKDGSFPISDVEDLKDAIQAHGRAKDIEAAKKHIMKRARILKKSDLIPDEWSKPRSTASALAVASLREKTLVASALAEFAKFSDEERMKLADKGFALPDGSFPIRNEDDLRNAIRAYGRAEKTKRVTVRKHIMKRARALRKEYLVPEDWTNAGSAEATSVVASMRSRISEFAVAKDEISDAELKELKEAKEEAEKQTEEEIKAAEEVKSGKAPTLDRDEDGSPKYISGVNQPRDAKGKYRKVLARLKQDLGVAGLAKALKKAEAAENLDFAGDYVASATASSELLDMIDRLDSKALNPEALENVRLTAAELGKTIANLPLPFGKDAEKIKFSDLPAGLKDLIDQMITRVESKIGKKDADIATQSLRSYMAGADVYSQGEVQSEMSKLLRLLT